MWHQRHPHGDAERGSKTPRFGVALTGIVLKSHTGIVLRPYFAREAGGEGGLGRSVCVVLERGKQKKQKQKKSPVWTGSFSR